MAVRIKCKCTCNAPFDCYCKDNYCAKCGFCICYCKPKEVISDNQGNAAHNNSTKKNDNYKLTENSEITVTMTRVFRGWCYNYNVKTHVIADYNLERIRIELKCMVCKSDCWRWMK